MLYDYRITYRITYRVLTVSGTLTYYVQAKDVAAALKRWQDAHPKAELVEIRSFN